MMKNNTSYYEFKVFLSKNKKLIIGSAFSVFLALLLILLISFRVDEEAEEITEEINEELVLSEILPAINNIEDVGELSEEEREIFMEYLDKESYSIRLVIENPDSSAFVDNKLLKELLLEDSIIQRITEESESEFIPTPEIAVSVSRVEGSSMMKINVGTGTREYNEEIINYFVNLLDDNTFSLLENRDIYFVDSEPIIYEELEEEQIEGIIVEEDEGYLAVLTSNIEIILIVSLIGLLGGISVGIVLSIFKEKFNKNIPSIYSFNLLPNHTLIKLDSILPKTKIDVDEVIVQSIVGKNKTNKLIMSEHPLSEELYNSVLSFGEQSNAEYNMNISNMEKTRLENIEEIIILIQNYRTSKLWFEKQIEQTKALQIPVKIIRIP